MLTCDSFDEEHSLCLDKQLKDHELEAIKKLANYIACFDYDQEDISNLFDLFYFMLVFYHKDRGSLRSINKIFNN